MVKRVNFATKIDSMYDYGGSRLWSWYRYQVNIVYTAYYHQPKLQSHMHVCKKWKYGVQRQMNIVI